MSEQVKNNQTKEPKKRKIQLFKRAKEKIEKRKKNVAERVHDNVFVQMFRMAFFGRDK